MTSLDDKKRSLPASQIGSLNGLVLLSLLVMLLGFGNPGPARAETDPNRILNVVTHVEGETVRFYVQNLQVATVTTTFDMSLTNMTGSTNFPCTFTLAGHQTLEVFTLAPVDTNLPHNYSFSNASLIGSATAVPDDDFVYSLPYTPGNSFPVSQGYHGAFSHTGPDEYAIDWKMPVGTPVYAARDGLVVKSKDDSNRGGPDRKYLNCANCIQIQHADGTVGVYGHLKQGGNKVKVGDQVKAGELIGLSGNTGYAAGAHLHFAVFKAINGAEHLSLPVKFRTADNPTVTLEAGRRYKAAVADESPRNDKIISASAGPLKLHSGS